MLKARTKKNDSPAKTQRPKSTEKNNTAQRKRKQWMMEKFRKKKPPPKEKQKAKAERMVPPTDAQQFSANWKILQEVCQQKHLVCLCSLLTSLHVISVYWIWSRLVLT